MVPGRIRQKRPWKVELDDIPTSTSSRTACSASVSSIARFRACLYRNLASVLLIIRGEATLPSPTGLNDEAIKARWNLLLLDPLRMRAAPPSNGYLSADQLAGFIQDTKTRLQHAGYSGPVTTTAPPGTIQENSSMIFGAVDVIAAKIHPFFSADVTAEKASEFVASQLSYLSDCCNNENEAYNLETGWRAEGSPHGVAVPGYAEQKAVIEADAGAKSVLFSYHDDMWKSRGDLGVEQYWGCLELSSD